MLPAAEKKDFALVGYMFLTFLRRFNLDKEKSLPAFPSNWTIFYIKYLEKRKAKVF